jgi:hypothetical protein
LPSCVMSVLSRLRKRPKMAFARRNEQYTMLNYTF